MEPGTNNTSSARQFITVTMPASTDCAGRRGSMTSLWHRLGDCRVTGSILSARETWFLANRPSPDSLFSLRRMHAVSPPCAAGRRGKQDEQKGVPARLAAGLEASVDDRRKSLVTGVGVHRADDRVEFRGEAPPSATFRRNVCATKCLGPWYDWRFTRANMVTIVGRRSAQPQVQDARRRHRDGAGGRYDGDS